MLLAQRHISCSGSRDWRTATFSCFEICTASFLSVCPNSQNPNLVKVRAKMVKARAEAQPRKTVVQRCAALVPSDGAEADTDDVILNDFFMPPSGRKCGINQYAAPRPRRYSGNLPRLLERSPFEVFG